MTVNSILHSHVKLSKKQLQSTIKCDIQRTYSHCMEDKVILLGLWWKMCIQSSCSFPHAQTLNPRDVLSERSEKRLSGTRLVFCKEHLKLSCSPKLLKKENTTAATRKKAKGQKRQPSWSNNKYGQWVRQKFSKETPSNIYIVNWILPKN